MINNHYTYCYGLWSIGNIYRNSRVCSSILCSKKGFEPRIEPQGPWTPNTTKTLKKLNPHNPYNSNDSVLKTSELTEISIMSYQSLLMLPRTTEFKWLKLLHIFYVEGISHKINSSYFLQVGVCHLTCQPGVK